MSEGIPGRVPETARTGRKKLSSEERERARRSRVSGGPKGRRHGVCCTSRRGRRCGLLGPRLGDRSPRHGVNAHLTMMSCTRRPPGSCRIGRDAVARPGARGIEIAIKRSTTPPRRRCAWVPVAAGARGGFGGPAGPLGGRAARRGDRPAERPRGLGDAGAHGAGGLAGLHHRRAAVADAEPPSAGRTRRRAESKACLAEPPSAGSRRARQRQAGCPSGRKATRRRTT